MKRRNKLLAGMLIGTVILGAGLEASAANPLLPLDEFIPDVEANVFTNSEGEERLYLYGSHDDYNSGTWCSHQYRVWSAPLTDLNDWTDHGVSMASKKGQGYIWNGQDADGISWSDRELYAPDVDKIGDTYYLVTCNAGGPCLGMSTSKTPEGPFSPAKKILWDDGTETGNIDPTLYVEGEGENTKVYLLWGQTTWFGGEGLVGAEMAKDEDGLYTIVKKDTKKILFGKGGDAFGFYEGASLKKINGKYYILYPSNKGAGVHMMSYAVADSPLGDYKFGGNILDNDGCDLQGGNNHGSFCEIDGQWYLFYHRGFGNSNMRRKVCAEKIFFDEETGKIYGEDRDYVGPHGETVRMTNHGLGGPMSPYERVEAANATHVRLDGFKSGCYLVEKSKDLHPLINITNGNCVEYRDFDFGKEGKDLNFTAEVQTLGGGSIDVILDDPKNEPVGTLILDPTENSGYHTVSAPVSKIKGVHTVYLKFNSEQTGNICELASFSFTDEDAVIRKDQIEINGIPFTEFSKYVKEYTVYLKKGAKLPRIKAYSTDETVKVSVKGPESIPGSAVITFGSESYTIHFKQVQSMVMQSDMFKGDSYGDFWEIKNANPANVHYEKGVGLKIKSETGDIGNSSNPAKNMFLQDAAGDWTIETALSANPAYGQIGGNWPSGGLVVYGDEQNFVKLVYLPGGVEFNTSSGEKQQIPVSLNDPDQTLYLKLEKKGNVYRAYYSTTDQEEYREFAATRTLDYENPKAGLLTTGFNNGTQTEVTYKMFRVETAVPQTDMFTADTFGDFWKILNSNPANVNYVPGEGLRITTEAGDIGNNAKNMFLQNAGGDWTVETAFDTTPLAAGNWPSAGIVVYGDEDNWLKLIAIQDRISLQGEKDGKKIADDTLTGYQKNKLYLKLQKTGNTYQASWSWGSNENYETSANTLTFEYENPQVGLAAPGYSGGGQTVTFEMFHAETEAQDTWPDDSEGEDQSPKEEYAVSIDGEAYTTGAYNTRVTLAVPEKEGKTFTGWAVDGNIISTDPNYTFYIAGDVNFVPMYEEVYQEAEALISNVITTKRPDGKYDVKFVGQIIVPDGYTLEDAGLVWSSSEDTELALGAAKETHITKISDTNQFSVTIKGMPEGRFIRGKVFASFKNTEENVVYSVERTADPQNVLK